MPPKKRPGDRWFKLAPYDIWQEHETPKDDSYVAKEDEVIAWSLVVVKGAQYKVLPAVKVGSEATINESAASDIFVTCIELAQPILQLMD